MGRLFWKIFIAFFLALVSTAITVGNLVHWQVAQSELQLSSTPQFRVVPTFPETSPRLLAQAQQPYQLFKINPAISNSLEVQFGKMFLSFPLAALIFCLVSSAVFAAVLAWSIAHPIKLLLEHLKRAADGDLQTRVSPKIGASHDEFAELGAAFDQMAIQLNNMIKSQSNMLHHVSHELRSPLARIQMAVGLVQQDPKKTQTSLQRVELEAVRMEKMISELLEMFRLESGMQRLNKVEVDMNTLVTGIVNDVHFENEHTNIKLLLPEVPVFLMGQLELLHRAVENIVRNAVKYGPPGGQITVELQLSERTGEVIVEVQDEGNGVAPDEMDQIFKPFVRGRGTTQIEGHGIGLAMTKYVVEAHGGYVSASNLSPQGFMMRLHLPLHSESD